MHAVAADCGKIALVLACAMASSQQLRVRQVPQTQSEMHARVTALYSFHPSQVSDAERQKKSGEMDVFWNEMKATPDVTLPLLRTELRDASNPTFFFTDGTELLLALSKARDDEQLAADTLPHVDLKDTQSGVYFFTLHQLACDGANVTDAALHILDDPTFKASVPQHAMVLDQRMSLMYVLLSMKEELWVGPAIRRFGSERDPHAKQALLSALFYAQTNESDKFVKAVAADTSQEDGVRSEAQEFEKEVHDLAKSWLPMKGTVEELRVKRRKRLQAVSDEAIGDVQWDTRKITQIRAKSAR